MRLEDLAIPFLGCRASPVDLERPAVPGCQSPGHSGPHSCPDRDSPNAGHPAATRCCCCPTSARPAGGRWRPSAACGVGSRWRDGGGSPWAMCAASATRWRRKWRSGPLTGRGRIWTCPCPCASSAESRFPQRPSFWQNAAAGDGPEPWFPSRRAVSHRANHRSLVPFAATLIWLEQHVH